MTFVGHVPDPEVAALLSSARALVVTATEEFGIAAVEAQAAGRPVIAPRAGGVLETVIDGRDRAASTTPGTRRARRAPCARFDALAVDPAAASRARRASTPTSFRAGLLAQIDPARAA